MRSLIQQKWLTTWLLLPKNKPQLSTKKSLSAEVCNPHMTYVGTIVEESLKDSRYLNQVKITGVRISSAEIPENRWHLYKVSVDETEIENLSQQLKPEKWYMHFWNG